MATSTEQNKRLIQRFWEAMNKRQLETLDGIVARDVVRHCQATPDIEVRSLDQLKDFLRQDTAVFPDSIQTITHLVAEDDLVAVWARYEGTQMGAMASFPPKGARVQFDFGAVFRVENGKIAESWVTWDNMTVLRSLGHLTDGASGEG
jgi:steroid delta-isomerase-like uncharacterized protein